MDVHIFVHFNVPAGTAMPRPAAEPSLSRREREVMDIVHRLGEATVADVLEELPDAAGYNAVRNTLGILAKKKHLRRRRDGQCYVYSPIVPRVVAGRGAARRLLRTFFAESPRDAILTLLDLSAAELTDGELDEIVARVERSREER